MINYNSNIEIVINTTVRQIQEFKKNLEPTLRTVAMVVLPELKHRVHIEGKDSNGGQIGTYSKGYMSVRTGIFKNDDRKIKVKDKRESEKEFKKKARPKYNRTTDTKVILSLTRQMENDLSIISTNNGYGIGYLNSFNYQKAMWCEAIYKKPILSKLTTEEKILAKRTAENFLSEYLK